MKILIITLLTSLLLLETKTGSVLNMKSTKNLVVEKQIDLEVYPQQDNAHPACPANQVTIGDCHSNPLKIIHFLIKQNILNLEREDYKTLKSIFNNSEFNNPQIRLTQKASDDIETFNKILSNTSFNPVGMVRFIGDIIADRGPNDYFILKILQALNSKRVPVEILLSNHDLEFIRARENIHVGKQAFELTWLLPNFTHSMLQMQRLIDNKVISMEDVLNTFDSHYKPNLRAISYSLSPDKQQITLFSHAPVDYRIIKALVNKLNTVSLKLDPAYQITFADESPELLAKTIDRINEVFAYYVNTNSTHILYDDDKIAESGGLNAQIDFNKHPFEFLIWNRNFKLKHANRHPNGYKIAYAYGHTDGIQTEHVFPLDNTIGKNRPRYQGLFESGPFDAYEISSKGEYHIHFSQDIAPQSIKPQGR